MMLLLLACNGGFQAEPVAEVTLTADELPGREWRRMDIDQLDASLQAATGGHTWTEDGENLFVKLSGTLGKPDYLGATSEDVSPGLLFQKFLDDGAKQVCTDFVWDELSKGEERLWLVELGSVDTLASEPELVEQAVARGLLRFHGKVVGGEDLQPWVDTFDAVATETGEPARGWVVLCVATITHPDFYAH